MKAIVLTYDKYHPFADHMIQAYSALWPDHPFTFRLPYQEFPKNLKQKYGDRIELVKTDSEIKLTALQLMEDLDDNDWILWCIDDKYPVELDVNKIEELYSSIKKITDPNISGFMFSFKRDVKKEKNIFTEKKFVLGADQPFYRRKNYTKIWMHQFMRVKVIRRMFQMFPDEIGQAKEMDKMKEEIELPNEHELYVMENSIAAFGESTCRGLMTANCAKSFDELGWEYPEGFKISNEEILMGKDKYEEPLWLWKLKQRFNSLLNR